MLVRRTAALALAAAAPALAQHLDYVAPRVGNREVVSRNSHLVFRIPAGLSQAHGLVHGEQLRTAAVFRDEAGELVAGPIPFEVPGFSNGIHNSNIAQIFWVPQALDWTNLPLGWLDHPRVASVQFGVRTQSGAPGWLFTPFSSDESVDQLAEIDPVPPRLLRAIRSHDGALLRLVFSETMWAPQPDAGANGTYLPYLAIDGFKVSLDGSFTDLANPHLPYVCTAFIDPEARVLELAILNGAQPIVEGAWVRSNSHSNLADLANNAATKAPTRVAIQGTCRYYDLDGDGRVGAGDLAQLLSSWGPVQLGTLADLDLSASVDSADLSQLLGAWGVCP